MSLSYKANLLFIVSYYYEFDEFKYGATDLVQYLLNIFMLNGYNVYGDQEC